MSHLNEDPQRPFLLEQQFTDSLRLDNNSVRLWKVDACLSKA